MEDVAEEGRNEALCEGVKEKKAARISLLHLIAGDYCQEIIIMSGASSSFFLNQQQLNTHGYTSSWDYKHIKRDAV